jgi:hypothetical protein
MKGLEEAKRQQQAIVSVGGGLIERKRISMMGPFRYALLDGNSHSVFAHPFALIKLGHFLLDALEVGRIHSILS